MSWEDSLGSCGNPRSSFSGLRPSTSFGDGVPPAAIDEEVSRYAGLIREGGFVPIVDHSIPPDVPLESYRRYRRLVDELCGT